MEKKNNIHKHTPTNEDRQFPLKLSMKDKFLELTYFLVASKSAKTTKNQITIHVAKIEFVIGRFFSS